MEIKYASFAEAIRAADGVIPQSFFGGPTRELLNVDAGKLCAIEAGLTMMEIDLFGCNEHIQVEELYPYLKTRSTCPRCGEESALSDLIWHLNDHHNATFSGIADWLETEEEKLGYVHLIETEAPNFEVALDRSTLEAEVLSAGLKTKS